MGVKVGTTLSTHLGAQLNTQDNLDDLLWKLRLSVSGEQGDQILRGYEEWDMTSNRYRTGFPCHEKFLPEIPAVSIIAKMKLSSAARDTHAVSDGGYEEGTETWIIEDTILQLQISFQNLKSMDSGD